MRPLTDEPLFPSWWVKPPLKVASRRQRSTVGHHHRTADGRVGRFVSSRVPGERGQGVVEPGDVGDDARIVALGAEGRDEHRRMPVDSRAGPMPDPFAGQGVGEDRFDRRWPGGCGRLRRDGRLGSRSLADRRQRGQLRATWLGGLPAVIEVLNRVDQQVAVMVS